MRRARIEQLLEHAAYLRPEEHALVRAVYGDGMSMAALARLAGYAPRTIQRRVRRLLDRMRSEPFQFVLRSRHGWPAERRRIAEAIFLEARTLRDTADRVGVTLHDVRRCVQWVRDQVSTTSDSRTGTRGPFPFPVAAAMQAGA